MNHQSKSDGLPEGMLAGLEDPILVTGAAGFIGQRVVAGLLARGFRNVRCLARRPGTQLSGAEAGHPGSPAVQMIYGNLLSPADCQRAVQGVRVIYHLAAGSGQKSFADAYLNSVVTTRNLVAASLAGGSLRRFVNISSFAVYSNRDKPTPDILDESCPLKERSERNGDAYAYAKIKQDELIIEYGKKHRLPYVLLRPGAVYGPGKRAITGRVGIRGTRSGCFCISAGPTRSLDLCGQLRGAYRSLTEAGVRPGVDGEVFNIVDDDLPSRSRRFLRLYKA